MLYDEFEACVAAGLDLERWIGGSYSVRFKNYIIAWYRLRRLVQAHTSDAEAKSIKAKSGH